MPDAPRQCGPCTACCSELGIAEFRKFPGPPCIHLKPLSPVYGDANHHRCGIYKDRPAVCSRFRCAWLEGLGPTGGGRPDRSGLMIVVYPPKDDEPMSATITVIDARRCGDWNDPNSTIQTFIKELLRFGFSDIKIINRKTDGVIYIANGLIRQGKLHPQTNYEDLKFEAYDPPIGVVETAPVKET